MTREELKEHCEKQIEMCEMWAIAKGEKSSGKIYEEHKLILELLEQQPCEDAISREQAIDVVADLFEMSEYPHPYSQGKPIRLKDIKEKLKQLPPVQPKIKTGHWISYWDEEARCHVYKCPECGNKQPFDTKCCWECGTRLVEPQESEDKE